MATKPGLIHELHFILLQQDQIDLLVGLLSYLDVEAIEQHDDYLVVYHTEQDFINNIEKSIRDLASWIRDDQIKYGSRPNENWNHSWESSFKPIVIEDFCTIKATFHDIDVDTPYTIIIDPEMAFGTGHHETTYGMIQSMSEMDFSDRGVLDFGSGTGILSILAIKLGAQSVKAIDYDDLSTECAVKCKMLNNTPSIEVSTNVIHDLDASTQYDIILANINRAVLLDTADEIYQRLKPKGELLLSGILTTDFDLVHKRYTVAGFKLIGQLTRGNWMTLRFG